MNKLTGNLATLFGLGYVPIAQGTVAALAGLALYFVICNNTILYIVITLLIVMIGFKVSDRAERSLRRKDAKEIVIDDFSGMLIALIFIPFSLKYIIIGFILYRFFDIIKLYPINRLEKLAGGRGIMLDDIAAGVYANLILRIIAGIW